MSVQVEFFMKFASNLTDSRSFYLMKSEDYVAQEAIAGANLANRPLSKGHRIAITATIVTALSLYAVVPKTNQPLFSSESPEVQSAPLASEEAAEDAFELESSASLTDALGLSAPADTDENHEVEIVKNSSMDNYDDALPESELIDSDDAIDKQNQELAATTESNSKEAPHVISSKWFTEVVAKGDTVSSIFEDLNIPASTAMAILDNKKVAKQVNYLQLGDKLSFFIDDNSQLRAFAKPIGKNKQIRFYRSDPSDNRFSYVIEEQGAHLNDDIAWLPYGTNPEKTGADKDSKAAAAAASDSKAAARADKPVQTAAAKEDAIPVSAHDARGRLVLVKIQKGDTFSKAANRAGITYSEINQISKLFKGRIQFSSNIHPGDTIRVLFSADKGKGHISAVEFSLRHGGKYAVYRSASGKYYDEKGMNSTKSAFRRFPLNGKIRVTSPFNPGRRHPVLGYVRPHNGTDFGVPVGTRVICPADGVVTKASYSRGSGYYIAIRHRGAYSTVYMHLSKMLVKPGQRVKMGDVIARSGNTGLSTGPHLHYELRINGRPVNAMKVDLGRASESQVENKERKRFVADVKKYKKELYNSSLIAKK